MDVEKGSEMKLRARASQKVWQFNSCRAGLKKNRDHLLEGLGIEVWGFRFSDSVIILSSARDPIRQVVIRVVPFLFAQTLAATGADKNRC